MLAALVSSALALVASAASANSTAPVADCADGGSGGGRNEWSLVMGPVHFDSLRARASDPAHMFEPERGAQVQVVKAPVIARAGRRARVAIARASRGRARLSFAAFGDQSPERLADGEVAVRVRACRRDEVAGGDRERAGDYTGWPSGFLVTGPGCVRIVVSTQGRDPIRRTARFGVKHC